LTDRLAEPAREPTSLALPLSLTVRPRFALADALADAVASSGLLTEAVALAVPAAEEDPAKAAVL